MESENVPEVLRGVVRGLHHVAIVVRSLEESAKLYVDILGMATALPEFVPDQKVNVLVLRAGEQRIELVEPASEDSPVSGFLEKRGGGLHHLAWRVDDVAAAIASLEQSGVRMIDREPRAGSHGTRIAFVHPKATHGVLMELVEDPA
ncbi:MAG: methylmalonyl-CoA/ethylmalonyl-CoA epimerase [Chlamydiales bacterium]|jgi:methylmalonyl-CoA/ethylmalonyl-CoA epimerase